MSGEAVAVSRKAPRRRTRVSKVSGAKAALGDFGKGDEILCLTMGQFSLIDLLQSILDITGPADVDCTTWTAAAADLSTVEQKMRDQRIKTFRLVVDYSFLARQPGYAHTIRERFGDHAIRTTRTHAKFLIVRNADWNVTVRTSMNLNENPRCEYFEVSDDQEIAQFFSTVVDQIFEEEKEGDFKSKKTPRLSGMEGVINEPQIRMSQTIRTGL